MKRYDSILRFCLAAAAIMTIAAEYLVFSFDNAYAARTPEWVVRKKPDDSSYKYYTGRGMSSDENEAFNMAYSDAMMQAIRDNFGGGISGFEGQTYEDEKSYSTTKRFSYNIPDVNLKNFEQADFWKDQTIIYVLFRYSKTSIEEEKIRLANARYNSYPRAFSESSSTDYNKGGVDIKTTPEDAAVFIDNKKWGYTPLLLKRKLSPGRHVIRLEHHDFDTVIEQLIINPGDVVKIEKTMRRAKANISVNSTPQGAKVFLDGMFIGTTPLNYRVDAGVKKTIRLEHLDAEDVSTSVVANKFEQKEININLPCKSTDISYENSGNPWSSSAGNIRTSSIDDENSPVKDKGSKRRHRDEDYPWGVLVGIQYSGNPYDNFDADLMGVYAMMERRFGEITGIQISGSYFFEQDIFSPADSKIEILTGTEATAAVPFFVGEMLCIRPEIGIFQATAISQDKIKKTETREEVESIFYGGMVGMSSPLDVPINLEMMIGARKYEDSEKYKGKVAITLKIGMGAKF